jgi:hypothetical protein
MRTKKELRISKILLIVFFVITILSVSATYYDSLVLRNYDIINDLDEEYYE